MSGAVGLGLAGQGSAGTVRLRMAANGTGRHGTAGEATAGRTGWVANGAAGAAGAEERGQYAPERAGTAGMASEASSGGVCIGMQRQGR